jgi:PAS domain S-box-containing protein
MGLLLNNTKESFIIVNSRLRIVTYNRAAQEHSPFFFIQELQSGVSLLDLVGANEIEKTIETFEKVFDGIESERETYFTDKDQQLHIYSHVYRPLFSEHEIVGVFITSTDITEKKKAQNQVMASEERYRTIIQESFDAMLIKDANYSIIEASPAIERLLGYAPGELIGKKGLQFVSEEHKEYVRANISEITKIPGAEKSIDIMVLHKNGNYVWVEMKARNLLDNQLIKGIIILLRDIAERKLSEELISLSEQRFKGLVQSGADMISIIDEEGNVKYSSPTVTTVLGNDPQKDIGRNVFDYMHPADKKRVYDEFVEMLRNGTRQLRVEPYRFLNAQKEYRWLETVVTNLSDDRAVQGIVINSRDVTETKRLNEEQFSLTQELVKNNQDLQQFSFITSHNLRAPVANLISLLSLYNKENIVEPFNQILIEKFEESTHQLNSTLNDLLEVLVLKSNTDIEKEQLNLSITAKQVMKALSNVLKEQNASITTDFSVIDKVEYNKVHLGSIFQNLISNAVKYRSPERNPVIKIKSEIEEPYTVITFEDNGMGIDLERYKDRIFGLYQRFHAGKEGKGLGLYMIKAQIMAMGGKIEVKSETGIGSIFKVYLKL